MSRTTYQYYYHDFYTTHGRLVAYLQQKGYQYIIENNEYVWKKGVGFWTAIKYVKIEYAPNNIVAISGWIRMVADKERDLSGFIGMVPKKQLQNLLDELRTQIY